MANDDKNDEINGTAAASPVPKKKAAKKKVAKKKAAKKKATKKVAKKAVKKVTKKKAAPATRDERTETGATEEQATLEVELRLEKSEAAPKPQTTAPLSQSPRAAGDDEASDNRNTIILWVVIVIVSWIFICSLSPETPETEEKATAVEEAAGVQPEEAASEGGETNPFGMLYPEKLVFQGKERASQADRDEAVETPAPLSDAEDEYSVGEPAQGGERAYGLMYPEKLYFEERRPAGSLLGRWVFVPYGVEPPAGVGTMVPPAGSKPPANPEGPAGYWVYAPE